MEEFELDVIDTRRHVQLERAQEDISSDTTYSCWYCNEGADKGNLISPCKCRNQFVHLPCLEASANILNILHCEFCRTQYPLETKHKSLLKCYRDNTLLQMFREIRAPLFKILILIFYYLISFIVLIYGLYVITSYVNNIPYKICIITVNFYIWVIAFSIYITIPYIINFCNRIRDIYSQWYKNAQEFKIKEQYLNDIGEI